MWATSTGDRTLVADEAQLFLNSVGYLHDMITSAVDLGEAYSTDVAMFNTLQPTQQMAMLHEVAHGLLDPETPIVKLTAVREATVYAIYRQLNSLLEIEFEMSQMNRPDFYHRETMIRACQQTCSLPSEWSDGFEPELAPGHEPPDLQSVDLNKWKNTVEFLADQVLWDRDFELEAVFADHDPQKVKAIKQFMGINNDYFAVAAPDANSQEYMKLHRELVGLTRSLRHQPNMFDSGESTPPF